MITIQKGILPLVLSFKTIDFPAGELSVRVDTSDHRFRDNASRITITARIQNHRDFMELVMATSAVQEWAGQPECLVLPYLPNSRQDRVCAPGDAFGLLAFARQIAALGFKELVTFDPHSEVAASVFKALGMKVTVITQATIIGRFDKLNARLQPAALNAIDRPLFVSPDAGANKRVSDLAALFTHPEFIRADKLRDLATGRIKETVVYGEAMAGRDVVILDDILDGGASFIPLAAALKAKGARRVELYITHGMFSKGIEPIFNGGIDAVWTTNSYRTDLGQYLNPRLTVLDLEEVFSL